MTVFLPAPARRLAAPAGYHHRMASSCGATPSPWLWHRACDRPAGHSGRHADYHGDRVVAVWGDRA